MRLTIEHETYYRFNEPANHSIQYLRLTPRADPSQTTMEWSVSTQGKVKRWVDGFGNTAHVSVQDSRHDEVSVKVRGLVETIDTYGVTAADDGLPSQMFLRATPYTELNEPLHELAFPFIERMNDEGLIAALHALTWTVHNTVTYQAGITDAASTAAQALEHGQGVCQDHAHLFIACARVLGVPARYVSGYLYDTADAEASLASHAWAEAYVEDLGWVSFDPSNCQCATEAYVRLAVAFDYAGACPIRGVRKGGGLEEMSVRVQVMDEQ